MKNLLAGLIVVAAGVLAGCGGGGQSSSSACKEIASSAAKTVAASVSTVTQGSGVYIIQGDAMDGVAGIDLNISYPSTLSSPTVTQGALISGAMMVANTNNPGSIKIAIISSKGFSGSGELVRITFANQGSGTITVSASMINGSTASGSATGSSGTTSIGSTTSTSSTAGAPFTTTSTAPVSSTSGCP